VEHYSSGAWALSTFEAQTELNPVKRRQQYKRILDIVAQDVPALYIGFSPRIYAYRKYVKGFTADDNGSFRWWGGGLNYTGLDK